MREKKRRYGPLLILLGGLYLILAVGIALLSSQIYRMTVAGAEENFTQRTTLSYLVNQVRQNDVPGGIALGTFGGKDALFLRDDGYVTILYAWDGSLRELYTEDGTKLQPEDGLEITALSDLSIGCKGKTLSIMASDETGSTWSVQVTPRCEIEQEAGT